MKKIILSIIVMVVVLLSIFAANAAITKGPYLQDMTSNSIKILWETDTAGNSRVDFGPTAKYEGNVVNKAAVTIHEVQLTNLKAFNTYHYKVTTGTDVSTDHTFKTAPTEDIPFTFGAYGDTRTNPVIAQKISNLIKGRNPTFVLFTGDFTVDGTVYANWSEQFFTPAANLIADITLFPVWGNHEGNPPNNYYKLFSPPTNAGSEDWYSFNYSNAHFVGINTFKPFNPGSAQYNWLSNDLANAHKDWIFVMNHQCPYTSGSHYGDAELPDVRTHLVPLFEKYKVAIAFFGHDHLYERSIKDNITYIITGGGGAPLYFPMPGANSYSKVALQMYNYCITSVNGSSVTFTAYNDSNSQIDSFTLKKVSQLPAGSKK